MAGSLSGKTSLVTRGTGLFGKKFAGIMPHVKG